MFFNINYWFIWDRLRFLLIDFARLRWFHFKIKSLKYYGQCWRIRNLIFCFLIIRKSICCPIYSYSIIGLIEWSLIIKPSNIDKSHLLSSYISHRPNSVIFPCSRVINNSWYILQCSNIESLIHLYLIGNWNSWVYSCIVKYNCICSSSISVKEEILLFNWAICNSGISQVIKWKWVI